MYNLLQVGYTNIDNQDGVQEILLRIYAFSVTTHSGNITL